MEVELENNEKSLVLMNEVEVLSAIIENNMHNIYIDRADYDLYNLHNMANSDLLCLKKEIADIDKIFDQMKSRDKNAMYKRICIFLHGDKDGSLKLLENQDKKITISLFELLCKFRDYDLLKGVEEIFINGCYAGKNIQTKGRLVKQGRQIIELVEGLGEISNHNIKLIVNGGSLPITVSTEMFADFIKGKDTNDIDLFKFSMNSSYEIKFNKDKKEVSWKKNSSFKMFKKEIHNEVDKFLLGVSTNPSEIEKSFNNFPMLLDVIKRLRENIDNLENTSGLLKEKINNLDKWSIDNYIFNQQTEKLECKSKKEYKEMVEEIKELIKKRLKYKDEQYLILSKYKGFLVQRDKDIFMKLDNDEKCILILNEWKKFFKLTELSSSQVALLMRNSLQSYVSAKDSNNPNVYRNNYYQKWLLENFLNTVINIMLKYGCSERDMNLAYLAFCHKIKKGYIDKKYYFKK